MNSFDRERERIGRQLEGGLMTRSEHKRFKAGIDRAEERARKREAIEAEQKAKAKRELYERMKERRRLRGQLHRSLYPKAAQQ